MPTKWTRDHEKHMLALMMQWYNESQAERRQWNYQAKRACRQVYGGCCQTTCEVGVGTAASLVWILVFVPRGALRAVSVALSKLSRTRIGERIALAMVGFLRFFVRWLGLVVMGAVLGAFAQALLCCTVLMILD